MPKDAIEAMDEVVEDRTIDEFMRRDPKDLTVAEYLELIQAMRSKRALFIKADQKKREG